MRTWLRGKVTLLFLTLGLLLAVAGVAVADIIQADADGDTVAVSSTDSFTLQPGASAVRNVSFQLACGDPSTGANSQPNQRHVESNQSISIASNSFSFPAGGAFALDPTVTTDDTTTIASSSAWPTDGTTCADYLASHPGSLTPREDSGNIPVKITAPLTAGTYTYTAKFEATESPAGPDDQQDLANSNITTNPTVKKLVEATYTVTVPNVAPVINSFQVSATDDGTSATEGQTKTYTISASDANGNALTYSLTALAGSASTTITGANTTSPQVKFNAPGTVTLRETVSDGTNTVTRDKTVTVNPACTATTSVTTQPQDVDSIYGADATFEADANGTNPTVKWQVLGTGSGANWTDIPNATSKTLTLTKPPVADSGKQYRAVFTNTCGAASTVTSNAALLTVGKATANVTLSGLGPYPYDGTAHSASASTSNPAGLSVGITYNGSTTAPTNAGTYNVVATVNDANYQGTANGSMTINRASGSVSITNLTNDAVFDGSFTPNISASGDGQTSVESLTTATCTVSNAGVVNFVGVGPCTLKSSVAQGTNYEAATNQQSFDIAKAHATLTLSGLTGHTYSGLPQGATVTTDPAGLNGVSVTYNGNTQEPTNAGSYAVVASLDNPNYEADNATGNLVIDKKSLTVTAENKQSTFNDANLPANTVTYTNGFVNNEGPGVLSGTLSYKYYQNGNEVTPQNAGTYAIRPSGLTSGNYAISFVDGTLTIAKANQTIDFAALSNKMFGDAPFTVSATASSNLPVSFTASGNCTISGNTVTLTLAGSCTITAKQVGNGNYNAAPDLARTFTIGAWTLNGFYQPVDMDVVTTTGTTTALNTVKNGSTVPMKFNVLKGATQLTDNTNNAVVKSFTQQSVLCPSGAGVVADEIEITTTGGTSLRYDATAGQWVQNWQTPKKPGTCYNVTLTTQDGSKLLAHFQLK